MEQIYTGFPGHLLLICSWWLCGFIVTPRWNESFPIQTGDNKVLVMERQTHKHHTGNIKMNSECPWSSSSPPSSTNPQLNIWGVSGENTAKDNNNGHRSGNHDSKEMTAENVKFREWLEWFLTLICWRKKNSFFYMHITRTKGNLEWQRYKWGIKKNKQKEVLSSLSERVTSKE